MNLMATMEMLTDVFQVDRRILFIHFAEVFMSRSRVTKLYFKHAMIQPNLLNYRTFQRNQRRIALKPTIDKSELSIQKLAPLHEIDELLKFSQRVFTVHQHYVAQRIQELLNVCAEDEDVTVSADSLKSMLLFLIKLQNFNRVSMTVSEEGLWHLDWEKNDVHSITLRFKELDNLDYAIFLPSQYVDKPIILSGSMNIFDFIEQLVIKNNLINQLLYK